MKISVLFVICIGFLTTGRAVGSTDPFGGPPPSWTESVNTAKPLRLEICFGEIPATGPASNTVTPGFLAAAKTLRIAVAPDDEGHIETTDPLTAVYRLRTKDNAHSLDLNFTLAAGGRREINTSVTITDQWVVFGGLTRTEVITPVKGKTTETRKNLLIAVRLVPAKP
jgi:hypothetical protein